jgi:hypothetical protein
MNPPNRPPTKPLENDPNELDRFKREIDLVDYAEKFGYSVKKQGPRGDWQQLQKEGETLIVTRKGDHQVYMNPGDDRDKGSVVDFAKTRGGEAGQGLNLGQVRKELRDYLGEQQPQREGTDRVPAPLARTAPPTLANEDDATRRQRLISEVLGAERGLTDRTYLHGRQLTDSTIDSPAFQGRIYTAQQNEHKNTAFPLYNEKGISSVEQKNDGYKNLLPLPKDGVWVSHPTDPDKSKPIERLVISESAIDALAKYQLEHKGNGPNTLYVATAGTVTERQVDLIQKIIDKQEPKQIALANDNDAAGRRYNINYLNELQPSRKAAEVEGHLTHAEGSRPVEFHATAAGKYHTAMRVDIRHDNPQEGAQQLKQLTERVRGVNGEQAEPTLTMEVQRSSAKETVVRLEVPNGDVAQLEKIAQQLYQQREQARPEAERNPANFVRAEYPVAKDYARDLELYAEGRTAQQVQEQAAIEASQRAQASQEKQLTAERERQERERQERERQANTPEAQAARAEDNKRFSNIMVGLATAEVVAAEVATKAIVQAVVEPRPEPVIAPENRRMEVVMVSEPDTARDRQENQPRYATQVQAALEAQGAAVTVKPGLAVNYSGEIAHRVEVVYDSKAPTLEALSPTLDKLYQQPGVRLVESSGDTTVAERQQVVAGRERPVELPERQESLNARVMTLYVAENVAGSQARGEQVQARLQAAGAEVGVIETLAQFGNEMSRIPVSYRIDQKELGAIDKSVNELKNAGVVVEESYGSSLNRQYVVVQNEKAEQQARQQTARPAEATLVVFVQPSPGRTNEDTIERLRAAGADAYATKENEMVRVNINTARPELVAINDELVKIDNDAKARTGTGVVVESPDIRTQREAAVAAALLTAQPEVIRRHEQALEARTLTATVHTYPGTTQAETIERLRAAGADAEASRTGDMVRVHYNTGRPEIVAVNAELSKINAESLERSGVPAVKELRTETAFREAAAAQALSNGGPGQPIGPGVTTRPLEAQPEQLRAASSAAAPDSRPTAPAAAELAPVATPAEPAKAEPVKVAEPNQVGVEKQVVIKVDEPEPQNDGKGRANAIAEHVEASGAKVGTVHRETDDKGIRHSEMQVSYRTDSPQIGEVSRTLDAVNRANGVTLQEAPGDRGERQAAAAQQQSTVRSTEEVSR